MLFIMLTRLIGKEIHATNQSLEELEKKVEEKIKSSCPDVRWKANYAVFGPYDYVDIFEAPDLENALKVATLVRSFGHASTEIWPGFEWKEFKRIIAELPEEP